MTDVLLLLFNLILYLIPFYIANGSAVVCGGFGKLDFGKKWMDGKRILGDGKTWSGTLGGILFGTASGFVLNYLGVVHFTPHFVLLAFLTALGAIAGDILGSFIKRRNQIESGQPAPFLDQLDFLAGGMILGAAIYITDWSGVIIAIAFTLVLHRLTNWIAWKWKLKKVPW